MRCALLFGLALALSPGRGVAEDWDLTREPAGPAAKKKRARTAPGPDVAPPGGEVAGAGQRQALLAERYVKVLLGDALDAFAFERLLTIYRERDGNLGKLADELAARPAQERERFGLQLLRARVDAARGEREAARGGFAHAAELEPRSPAPLVLAAALEREAGDLARAAQLLERALPLQTGRARADLSRQLAELALDRKDFAQAEQRYEEVAAGQGASVTAAAEYARALAARGEHARAATAFVRAIDAQRGDDRVLPPLLLELARAQLEAGDGEAAQASLERARKLTQPGSGLRYEVDEVSVDVERRLGRLPDLVTRLAAERSADFAHHELLGRLYEELGDGAQALASYRAALARNPRHEASRLRVIQLLTQRGELEQAIAEYRTLVRLSPREPRFVVELGKLLFQAGRREEALVLLVQTGQRNPRDARIHRALLELYTRWEDKKRAADELALLHRIEPDDPAHIVALGEQQLDEGDSDKALATWKRLLQNAPDKARAHASLGGVLLDHDLPERALAEYEAALQIAPDELEFVRGAAETLERLQRSSEAAQRWEQVLTLATERSLRREARRRVVRLWAASGELARKTAEFERAFASDAARAKPDAEAGRFLAECYRLGALGRNQALGDPRKLAAAEAVLARVIEIEPGDVESLLSLERLRATRGDLNGAIDVLAKLLEADPKNAQSYLARMSEHALAAYRDADAVAYAERLSALSPNDARVHERLGDLYRVRQNAAGAIASYERAVALDDRAFAVMLQLAELHLSRGEIDDADGVLRRVLRTCPDDELVKRAGRSLLQLHLGTERMHALEQQLAPLALAQSARPVYRRLLIELYEASSRPLIETAREAGPAAAAAREELAALGQRAIKPLLEALADPDPAQSRLAIELLSYLRNEHAAVPLLRAAEAEGDTQQRRRALLGAGAVAKAALAPRFAALARAPERRLRTAAAFGLARMEGPPAIAALRELLGSGSPGVRGYALLGLGRLRDQASQPAMRQALLGDRNVFARGAAALALGLLGDRAAVPALTAALRTEPGDAAAAAAVALALLAERAAAEPLAEAVFTSDAQLRAAALFALSSLARGEKPAWPELPEPGESDERLSLAPVLAAFTVQLAPSDRDAALHVFEAELRSAAEAALEGPRETAAAALALLSGRDAALRGVAGATPPRGLLEPLLPAVAKLAEHPDPALRAAALALLSQADAAVSAAPFVDALADDDPAVQRAALAALGTAPAASAPLARDHLARIATTDTRFWMRMRAVAALARGASEREVTVLISVLRSDADAYVREAAASALGELRAAAAAAALRLARERDPEPAVRTSAARALAKIGTAR